MSVTRTIPAAQSGGIVGDRAVSIVRDYFSRSIAATEQFFAANADAVADVCFQLARRFERGGSILVFGDGAQASDAHHVAVEFVHPVIVGKRALPALALTSGSPTQSLERIGRPEDIAIGLFATGDPASVRTALAAARNRGMYTLLLCGRQSPEPVLADAEFHVHNADPLVVQEIHETLYHVLWELVHVFLENPAAAVLDENAMGASSHERELYPFLFGPEVGSSNSIADTLQHVQASTRQKSHDIADLRRRVLLASAGDIAEGARALAERLRRGGTVLGFGNGGSATDAEDLAADCMHPPAEQWQPLSALALTSEMAIVTAVANDVGFDHVFARQVAAFGHRDDVAVGFSTSGASRNVMAAMAEAKSRGMLTIGFSGGTGGALAQSGDVDFCFTVPAEYTPRIQEAHATIWHALLTAVQSEMRPEPAATGAGKTRRA